MTPLWARLDDTATYPLELSSCDREGWMPLPPGTPVETATGMMVEAGHWVARPAIGAPVIEANADGWIVSYGAVPEGTACAVVDRVFGWLETVPAENGTIAFLLVEAGSYQLEILAPRPWCGRTDNLVLP